MIDPKLSFLILIAGSTMQVTYMLSNHDPQFSVVHQFVLVMNIFVIWLCGILTKVFFISYHIHVL